MPRRPAIPPAEDDWDVQAGGSVAVEAWLGAPALSYPRRPRGVLDVLAVAIARWPDRTAFVVGDERLTYRAFGDRVEQAAASLLARQLRPGDAVAVASGNTLELATLVFACARARLVMVGLNTRLAPAQWDYMVEHSLARLVLAAPPFDLPAAADLASVLVEAAPRPWSYADVDAPHEAETYAVVYTSGTTGRPKASQVVHRCSVHSAMSYQRVLQLRPEDVTAVLFPLYYISAMHAHVLPAMLAGATCVLVDAASPREYVELLGRERVTWAYAVPSWWRLCLRVPALRDLTELRLLAAGGAPFPADLVAGLRAALPAARLHDVYGLSETHSPACILRDEEFAAHAGTVGRPLDCMQAEVRRDDGTAAPAGEAGGLWLRGSLVTTGYRNDPQASARAIVDGWFDTGDIARIDDAGYVSILDRSKDMINRGGTKIFSAEVEELLRQHPAIEDAAVIAIPDPLAGEAVAAYVVASAPVTAADVRAWVREKMADYAAPKLVELMAELPRNAVGKTDKPALRARHVTS